MDMRSGNVNMSDHLSLNSWLVMLRSIGGESNACRFYVLVEAEHIVRVPLVLNRGLNSCLAGPYSERVAHSLIVDIAMDSQKPRSGECS